MKEKPGKKDYDKMWEKNKGIAGAKAGQSKEGLTDEQMSRLQEEDIAEQLFASEVTTTAQALRTEKNYVDFAKQVGKVLYDGQAPYNIPAFFKELIGDVGKSQMTTAEHLKKVLDAV